MTPSRRRGRATAARLAGLGALLCAMLVAIVGPAAPAAAISSSVVISQVYGGGGNNGATYRNDFIELFNRGTAPVSLAGWSVQYASSTGTSWQKTDLSGSLAPGQYYLVQQAQGAGGTTNLPTPDATGSIAMSGTAGKVALVNSATLIASGTGCPSGPSIVDFVGFGSATNCSEGSPTATLSNTTAAIRNANGCDETDKNSTDFAIGSPNPRNTASPTLPCGPAPILINEVLANTTGIDVEYIELYGEPGASLAGLSLIYVEGNDANGPGTIDFRYDFAAADTLGLNGFYLIGTAAGLQSSYGVTPNVTIVTNSLENSSATVALVQTASLSGTSVGGGESVLDAVGITDATASTFSFGAPVVGPDGSFFPAGARRVSDGVDTDAASDWVISDFNLGAANTPTAGTTADLAPAVASTSPAANAANVPVNSNVSVTFSESVDVAAGAISVQCPAGTAVASNSAANDVTVVTIDPASDLPAAATCVIQVSAAGVADNDGAPNALTGASSFSFTTGTATGATRIHAIQGSGGTAASGTFTVEAIVVGDYQAQGSGQLRGFFIQEEDADADANGATSEGIFVFCSSCSTPVSVGDKVRVAGSSGEFNGMSQLTATAAGAVTVLSSGNGLPTPASVQLPVPGVPSGNLPAATAAINAYFEAFEGMLVSFPDTLSVSEYFELARYGHVTLSEGGRPRTFTDANTPSAAGLVNHQIELAARTVILDDTDNRENGPVGTPNTAYYYPTPGLSTSNYFRGGDTITNLTGVLHWSFAGGNTQNTWRIRPVAERYSYAFAPANPRPAAPEVGGRLTVASFNVLNYFLSIDTSNTCAPTQNQDCRGADSARELERQRTKLLAALGGLNADVLGLIELENTPGKEPLADIVGGLSGYDYIDTGVIGGDAIRVGFIFKSATVRPVGAFKVLDSSVDSDFDISRNRPALAQTFEEIATGARFTVVVNHLKSKGSGCGAGDDDATTGQGNCNGTRTRAAEALARWLAADPTGSGDPDFLIIGDLNSYAKEDPIVALERAGYTNLVAAFGGPGAYSYVFDGQLGYLDHALANASLAAQVTDVDEWHINADEIPLFDYNDEERTADEATFEEESDVLPLYEPNAFRTSDHDPVVVGLTLTQPNRAPVANDQSAATAEDTPLAITLTADDADNDTLAYTVVGAPSNGTLSGTAPNLTYTPAPDFSGADSFTFQASDGEATSSLATVSITVSPVNDAPTIARVDGSGFCSASNRESAGFAFSVADVEGDAVTVTTSGASPFVTATVAAQGSGYVITFSVNADNQSREGTVAIVVTDAGGVVSTLPVRVVAGSGAADSLAGSAGIDVIFGGNGADQISGGDSADVLCGGNGDDQISGGDGADFISGGSGADIIGGGAGDDRLLGGAGDDTLTGDEGADFFDGGAGSDRATDLTPGDGDGATGIE